jgi:DNA repair protein RAD50
MIFLLQDLKKYIAVLDDAVIKFHAQRMMAVNEVLAGLWRAVYKGNDIEMIAVRSESVDEGEKRKAYNYRVVMTVDNVEVDMRGRCSAGQKVRFSR